MPEAYTKEVTVLLAEKSIDVLHGLLLTTYTLSLYSQITITGSGSISEDFTVSTKNKISGTVHYDEEWSGDFNI